MNCLRTVTLNQHILYMPCLVYDYEKKFLLSSLKTFLIYSKDPRTASEFLFWLSFSVIG
jgi:hypothetical protein